MDSALQGSLKGSVKGPIRGLLGLLKGSRDLVTKVISKVAMLISTYNPN